MTTKILMVVISTIIFTSPLAGLAQGTSAKKQQNLKEVQEIKDTILDKEKRNEYMRQNPDAAKNDQNVQNAAANPECADGMYSVAAAVFEKIADKSGQENPEQMLILLGELQSKPEKLDKYLNDSQRALIKRCAAEKEKQNRQQKP